MSEFRKVAEITEIEPGTALCVEIDASKIALFNLEGTIYAIHDTCTHQEGPLSEGMIDGETVTCPWHMSVFNIKTGEVLESPAMEGVKTYNVRIQGNDIEVEV